jgi:glycosyltransferase involved in cell wall biosynthesis
MTQPHVAILGPCHTESFKEHLSLGNTASLPPGMGGYNITHLVLARLAQGLRTDVITCDPTASSVLGFEGPLLRLWVIPRRQRHMMRDLYRQEQRLLRAAISASTPDCIHANWATEYALAASESRLPWILSMHDNPAALIRWIGPRHLVPFLLAVWLVRRAPVITGVSPHACDFAQRFARGPVTCIPNLLHMPLLSRLEGPASHSRTATRTVVAVLNWSAFKNTKRALLVFRNLRQQHPNVELKLLGPGLGPGGPAETWARAEGASEGVAFLGTQPYTACIAHIHNADVLFHPALEEAMGCQVAEAMALNTPVVCARQAKGPSWLTSRGSFGTLTDGTSVEAMTQAVSQALGRSAKDSQAVGAAAKAHILALTNAGTILTQYNDAYTRAIKLAC